MELQNNFCEFDFFYTKFVQCSPLIISKFSKFCNLRILYQI